MKPRSSNNDGPDPWVRTTPTQVRIAAVMSWLGPAVLALIGIPVLVVAIWGAALADAALRPTAIAIAIGFGIAEALLVVATVVLARGYVRKKRADRRNR